MRTWAEVLGDAEHRMKFVQGALQYESDHDSGLASMRTKYADFLPAEALLAESAKAGATTADMAGG